MVMQFPGLPFLQSRGCDNYQKLAKSTEKYQKYFNILRPGKRQIVVVIITENYQKN